MKKDRKLAIETFSSKFNDLSVAKGALSKEGGWISYIRMLLGMSSKQLAKRLGLVPSAITMAESQEVAGTMTINRMKKIAEALECEFVYGLVPKKEIEQIIEGQARSKAMEILKESMSMMELENQSVKIKNENNRQLNELIEQIKNDKYLWD